jgi:hypothetical protein
MKPIRFNSLKHCKQCDFKIEYGRSADEKFCHDCVMYAKPHLHQKCSHCEYKWIEYTFQKSEQLQRKKEQAIARKENSLKAAGLSLLDIQRVNLVTDMVIDTPRHVEKLPKRQTKIEFLKEVWNRITQSILIE